MAGKVDENGVLWNANQVGAFSDCFGGHKNLWETLVASAATHGPLQCAGVRKILEVVPEGGFEKLRMAPNYEWMTYSEYFKTADSLGAGLAEAIPGLKANDTVVIYADTQRDWMLAAYACWRQGYVVGTIYATLGAEGAEYGINQSGCKAHAPPAVVADSKLLKIHKLALRDDLVAAGSKSAITPTAAAPEETAVLMYTSGTTGNPKGVLISHKSLLCVMGATLAPGPASLEGERRSSALSLDGKSYLKAGGTYCAYLPLAHIMELSVELTSFAVLVGIKAKFAALPGILQGRVNAAIANGKCDYDSGGVQKLLGGNVELMKFVQTVFKCRVRQGYGLTETCAATCIALASDNTTAQGGYMNADKDNKEIGMPRGEILIGGPGVCDGYLVDPAAPDPDVVAKNRDEFVTIDGQRYFCTGDVGQYTPEGNLMIIDRKKDLVKLQQGEYVALSKVENVLKTSQYTALPMVYALSSMSYCIALICPNEGPLMKLAASLGVSGDLGAVCEDAKVVAAVLKDITAECKKGKLAKFEIPTKVILVAELWTPENELLTAVRKLKRREIVACHKAQIDKCYV
ncbi:hypothetical protein EMIHUDRAFT_459357 [Emiliania huxleyi CCMP1516]|uniref:AMP-dependent synthetase/ligase domain-containing protein n=2 Tax=Emiliania huxleyi TaxID=2903 RepID=A0A0D3IV97_EMIH1|nr:hypothetical protein EMIHUDRAFT_459357 [Emiliania huxleyi CCMP1516]EOD15182.1 hypothetical protein EMIHUDRAFT_459357 [Emiliania huxleyi CCMP1516]|eukprot:XP_005767611.1 hypothetical protein EMIHUDRAFT_459357 [Emiliania huxleyi CCMP1516]